jgi:hypothetical protein
MQIDIFGPVRGRVLDGQDIEVSKGQVGFPSGYGLICRLSISGGDSETEQDQNADTIFYGFPLS